MQAGGQEFDSPYLHHDLILNQSILFIRNILLIMNKFGIINEKNKEDEEEFVR